METTKIERNCLKCSSIQNQTQNLNKSRLRFTIQDGSTLVSNIEQKPMPFSKIQGRLASPTSVSDPG